MAGDINRVTIVGRLTRDPELAHLPSGTAVLKLGVAGNGRQRGLQLVRCRRRHPVLMPPRGGGEKRDKDRQPGRKRPGQSSGPIRRKSCFFCKDKVDEIDYKNVNQLRRYISERGKIRSRRITGACRRHQRQVAVAVKRAREMALLPYVSEGR